MIFLYFYLLLILPIIVSYCFYTQEIDASLNALYQMLHVDYSPTGVVRMKMSAARDCKLPYSCGVLAVELRLNELCVQHTKHWA